MRCMEIRGGNQPIEEPFSTPSLDGWVANQPYRESLRGGDVHFVSLCAGGLVTRLIVADVAGHGDEAADIANDLRGLMKRFINHKSQTGMVRALNREFTALARDQRFATAIVATYLAHRRRLTVCCAGHPCPLWFHAASSTWNVLTPAAARSVNLPLGIDEDAPYQQFSIPMALGDVLVFFTDGLIEARDRAGRLLTLDGLLGLARGLPSTDDPVQIGQALRESVARRRDGDPADDDLTLLVLRHNGREPEWPGVGETLQSLAKMCRLKSY